MNFNDYMRKASTQLLKELSRRGIPYNHDWEKGDMALAIATHDAYYNGINDERRKNENNIIHDSVLERGRYVLHDYCGETYHLSLTKDQAAIVRWIINSNIDLSNDSELESVDDTKYVEI